MTMLLDAAKREASARDDLIEVVYDQLRRIAQERMKGERVGHTLESTGLVHEAFLKLVGDENMTWESRGHFYGAAAMAMRRILVDHARRRQAEKRGGSRDRVPLNVVDLAEDMPPSQVLALDQALERLEEEDPRAASVVRLRFFAGLEVADVARVLDLSERTVLRDWAFARATLFEAISGEASEDG
ncbi:MAG: sigma-70 family RNA polymerase sigma factor [Phycisphaerales bacterium]|nr:sigma-70 family RNA polymerase sigma factor [Phycisphaerales bacterium]